MKIVFTERAWKHYVYWQSQDPKLLKRLNGLIEECTRTPFSGTGRPEALKGDLSGFWSRRINGEHRLVYAAEDDNLLVVQCRYHY